MSKNLLSFQNVAVAATTPSKSTRIPIPDSLRRPILVRSKILMGSGLTNPSPRVTEALSKPIMGVHDVEIGKIMDEIRDGLKYLFQTKNPATFCVTGSGQSGLECALGNLIEDGDVVLVCVTGAFGLIAAEKAIRYGADVRTLEAKPGTSLQYEQIRAHLITHKPKVLFIVHGESSVGVFQSLENLGDLCERNDCLLVVDAVNTLAAVELLVDEWKIDVAYSASHKALGAPPGVAPITFGSRALAKITNRKTKPKVYYFDAKLLSEFWQCTDKPRFYHHTMSFPLLYALREAIAEIIEQGLDTFRERHADNAQRLWEGLQNIGLELFVQKPEERYPSITAVRVPHGVKLAKVLNYLQERYSLEVSNGIGSTAGILFLIGTMNANATHQKVDLVLRALYDALKVTSNYIAPQSKVYY